MKSNNECAMKCGAINRLASTIHQGNVEKGFWEEGENRNRGELLALVHSEVSEALEALRKGRRANVEAFKASDGTVQDFKDNIKDTYEDEIADTIIRCLDLCGAEGIDIDFHIREKLKYNAQRAYKHGKIF